MSGAVPAWLSLSLCFSGDDIYGPTCDEVIINIIAPFFTLCRKQGFCTRCFFVRYVDPDAHVRIRLFGSPAVLRAEALPKLATAIERVGTRPPFGCMRVGVREGTYEKEYDRYGGPVALDIAERFFDVSTQAALDILPSVLRSGRRLRLGRALVLLLATSHAFYPERLTSARFLSQYARQCLGVALPEGNARERTWRCFDRSFLLQEGRLRRSLGAAWQQLCVGRAPSTSTSAFCEGLRPLAKELLEAEHAGTLVVRPGPRRERVPALATILASYIHMTNNRLGVTLAEESCLAYLAARTLDGSAAQ